MKATDYSRDAVHYAQRPIAGTDSLAFRKLEDRITSLGLTGRALDAGCGAGRSTRFLQSLGFRATGLDVSESMLQKARELDRLSEYQWYDGDGPFSFVDRTFDVLLSTWTVLEIDSRESLGHFVKECARVLRSGGAGFIVANTLEFYSGRWVSCEIDFPENRPPLRSGQRVKARLVPEDIVVHDTFWSDLDYREVLAAAGLRVPAVHRPLADVSEPDWRDETSVPPYVVYEVRKP